MGRSCKALSFFIVFSIVLTALTAPDEKGKTKELTREELVALRCMFAQDPHAVIVPNMGANIDVVPNVETTRKDLAKRIATARKKDDLRKVILLSHLYS